MKNIKFDSILLFSLVVPFIMNFRLSPGATPFWLFGIIFLSLLVYLILDLAKIKENSYFLLKQILLWIVIVFVVGSALVSAIIVRHQTAPIYMIHDIIIQQESAIRFLIHGINPYSATYFGTPLEQWHYSATEINPALYHFVMQPFYLLFAIPFYFISVHTIGFFDGRIPLFFLFFLILVIVSFLIKDRSKRLIALVLFSFNPAMLSYNLEGRSDIFMFAFLFLGLFLLHKNKYNLGAIPIALAFAVKQSVWPILPFYFAFLIFKIKKIKLIFSSIIVFTLTFGLIVIPFLFWNSKAFLDSTVLYLSGSVSHSYPISGYGLGMVLYEFGFIKNLHQYYPFLIWQVLIGVPVLICLLIYLRRSPSVSRLILVYGIFLFVFWYLSRYFNNSHLGYLSLVFISAYFWPDDKK